MIMTARGRTLKTVAGAMAGAGLVAGAFSAFSRLRYRRSALANL